MGKLDDMQEKYVEARLEGKPKSECASIAGYSPTTKTAIIERPGGPVANKIAEELNKRGINESYLAQRYEEAIRESKTPKGRVGDYNAHAKLLYQLGTLLGYGKKDTPGVAIQINNGATEDPDPERSRLTLERLEAIIGVLQEKVCGGEPADIHEGDSGAIDPKPHDAVDESSSEAQGDGGGGQP